MEDNIAFIKAELRALRSFVTGGLYSLYRIWIEKGQNTPNQKFWRKMQIWGQKFKLGFDY